MLTPSAGGGRGKCPKAQAGLPRRSSAEADLSAVARLAKADGEAASFWNPVRCVIEKVWAAVVVIGHKRNPSSYIHERLLKRGTVNHPSQSPGHVVRRH